MTSNLTSSPLEVNGRHLEGEEEEDDSRTAKLFERSRIKALADERENIQKKTFCKWVNSHLSRCNCGVQDLFVDLRDGKNLIRLLEILSGEKLPNPTRGRMRIHCLENVDKSLLFLNEQKVHLENIGAHDIVDGNPTIVLGLIWTIILRFQIQDITVEEVDHSEIKSAKDALLLWCQIKTAGYPNVNVRNFTTSWRDGLAFNALIHKHRPDLVDYNSLSKTEPEKNLSNAFEVAEKDLSLTKLLDVEDVNTEYPEEKSIITYLVSYYYYFSKMRAETVQGKRVAKILTQCLDNDKLISDYNGLTSDLLLWIEKQIEILNERKFSNSLSGVQEQLTQFKNYRIAEKPKKFQEKGEFEVLLFKIQSQMRANNMKPFLPQESKQVASINKAWDRLEVAEHERELALREELIRQEKLEQLAARCDRKAGMREMWLVENQRLVAQDNFGYDIAAVEAAIKKHEAIETDIRSYEERVEAVVSVAKELECENYHDIERINERKENVLQLWQYLLELLRARRSRLETSYDLQKTFQEMLYILDMMEEIKGRLKSEDHGKHLISVEELLKKHEMIGSEMSVLGSRIDQVDVTKFLEGDPETGYKPCSPEIVKDRIDHVHEAYGELKRLYDERLKKLNQSREMWKFEWNLAEEENWIKEKEQLMSKPDLGHDLTSVQLQINRHKVDEDEIETHKRYLDEVINTGKQLVEEENIGSERIQKRVESVEKWWKQLEELSNHRKKRLHDAKNFYQFFSDSDDVEAWMVDMLNILSSQDVGKDYFSVQSLIKKHNRTEEEIKSYKDLIISLHNQASQLAEEDRESSNVNERLKLINKKYDDLNELASLRSQRLRDSLDLFKLFNEKEGVGQWIKEKEKLIKSMEATENIEEMEVLKARYDTFDNELKSNAERVVNLNSIAHNLIQSSHPDSDVVLDKQKQFNNMWRSLIELSKNKKERLDLAEDVNQFYSDCNQTKNWIKDKEKLIESTDNLGSDLKGMIALQRRLSGLNRDLAVIEAKIKSIGDESEKLKVKKPEEAAALQEKMEEVQGMWVNLKNMLHERDERLGEVSGLQKFLTDLDIFQQWLSRTQASVSKEEVPQNLSEANEMIHDHHVIREELMNYESDYEKMRSYGQRMMEDQAAQSDPQYMFLGERLKALHSDWLELKRLWDNKQKKLNQHKDLQNFNEDSKYAEKLLSQQDNFLAKDELPDKIEEVDEQIRKYNIFEVSMETSDEKINSVVDLGEGLVAIDNFMAPKIQQKVNSIKERKEKNKIKFENQRERLKDRLEVLKLFQHCNEFSDWIGDRKLTASEEVPFKEDSKYIHRNWLKHQAFELELKSNKKRLDDIIKQSEQLISQRPDIKNEVKKKIKELEEEWNDLEKATKEKGEKIFDSNKNILYGKSCEEIDGWINETVSQLKADEVFNQPVPINLIIQKINTLETQLKIKEHQLVELDKQGEVLEGLSEEEKKDLIEKKEEVSIKFEKLKEPLLERINDYENAKKTRQFELDANEELSWIKERMERVKSRYMGRDLYSVQSLLNKNKFLIQEIENHQPRFESICEQGQQLVDSGADEEGNYKEFLKTIKPLWGDLKNGAQERKRQLKGSQNVLQYLFDVDDAEGWIGEQELYLLSDDSPRDEMGAERLMKKHEGRERIIQIFQDQVDQLGQRAHQLAGFQEDDNQILQKQKKLEKEFQGLKGLADDKKNRLNEVIKLYRLHYEIDDLEQWISEKEVVASSSDMPQDFQTSEIMIEKFQKFGKETEEIGKDRVDAVNEICEKLIEGGNSDAVVVAEWKDGINESWTDLLELIQTRNYALKAALEYFRFFNDCDDTLLRIYEKKLLMPGEEVDGEERSTSLLKRRLENFEHELIVLGKQVQIIQEESGKLGVAYSGEKAEDIQSKRNEVVRAWMDLHSQLEKRKQTLSMAFDSNKFFTMARDLLTWVSEAQRLMNVSEKPRDVSGVEVMMNNHMSLKAETDAREENFTVCTNLGKELWYEKHPKSDEIYAKLSQLAQQRGNLDDQWDDRWRNLQLIHEVYLFGRDASVAESWISTHEPHVLSHYVGDSLATNENLLRRHDALEKSLLSQDERFNALAKLTALEKFVMDKPRESPSHVEKYMKAYLPTNKSDRESIREEIEDEEKNKTKTKMIESDNQSRESKQTKGPIESEEPTNKVKFPQISLENADAFDDKYTKKTESQTSTSPGSREHAAPFKPGSPGDQGTLGVLGTKGSPGSLTPKSEKSGKSSSFRLGRRSSSRKDKKDDSAHFSSLGFIEGYLTRKHDWASATTKSTNRSWEKVYVVVTEANNFEVFKDAKHARAHEEKQYFRNEQAINLEEWQAEARPAIDYKKRENVFQLELKNGAIFLFQCKDNADMNNWMYEINRYKNKNDQKYPTLPSYKKDESFKKKKKTLNNQKNK